MGCFGFPLGGRAYPWGLPSCPSPRRSQVPTPGLQMSCPSSSSWPGVVARWLTPILSGRSFSFSQLLAAPGPLVWGPPTGCGGRAGQSRRALPAVPMKEHPVLRVANSGLGQLCSGAEAVISGQENSCLEQAPQACPHGREVIFPGGPSWLCAPCPLLSLPGSGRDVQSLPGSLRWAEVWLGMRPHLARSAPA